MSINIVLADCHLEPSLLGAMLSYASRWDDQMLDSLDP
jgi:hypothetical protein